MKVLNAIKFYTEEIILMLLVVAAWLFLAWLFNPDNIRNEIARIDAMAAERSAVQVQEYERRNFYDLQNEPNRFWQQCWNLNDSFKEELV